MLVPQHKRDLVILDGSKGEGGGQILRSALSLSLITGRPFRISKIRGRRSSAGLRPQHLACVRGAEAISSGRSQGAKVGASELTFHPGPVSAGRYVLEVGTAGSTPMLLQCLYYPLALSGGGELTLKGGTHVPHSPSYHYLSLVWLPAIGLFGFGGQLQLRYAGFYPEGGGEFRASVAPLGSPPAQVDLRSRGTLKDVDVTSFVGSLPLSIAERQAGTATALLREKGIYCNAENLPLPSGHSAGSAVLIRAEFERTIAGFSALGDKRKPAERVGEEAALELANFMESAGAIEPHLADQLLLPAGLLAAGKLRDSSFVSTSFTTSEVTSHLKTNAAVLQKFLPVRVKVDSSGLVSVKPTLLAEIGLGEGA